MKICNIPHKFFQLLDSVFNKKKKSDIKLCIELKLN